jgi:hypothetical protein
MDCIPLRGVASKFFSGFTYFLFFLLLHIVAFIFLFAFIYTQKGIVRSRVYTDVSDKAGDDSSHVVKDYLPCLYFSTVTFTTLGYGDFEPTEEARGVAALESIVGLLFFGLFVGMIVYALQLINERHRRDIVSTSGNSCAPEGKENATEGQRVSVENLHDPKSSWTEYGAVLIALFALGVSAYSVNLTREATNLARQATDLARQDLIAAHRPYVYVSSREDDKGTMDLKSVLLCCLNAPAKIIGQEFYYVVVKTEGNGEQEVSDTRAWDLSFTHDVVYPSEKTSTQIFFPYDFKKEILAKDQEIKLRRKARIDYKELSSDRTYYFEGNWDYDRKLNVWKSTGMFGN